MTTRSDTLLVTASMACLLAGHGQANPGSAAEAGGEAGAPVQAGQAVYEQHCVACHGSKGDWRDGHWNVVFVRELKSNEADDVKLTLGKPAPVAFAVWDGEHRDRNGKKLVSNWYQLLLEP